MSDLDVLVGKLLPAMQTQNTNIRKLYEAWRTSSSGERNRFDETLAALKRGEDAPPFAATSAFGKVLSAACEMARPELVADPDPDPVPVPVPSVSAYLNNLGEFGRPARAWGVGTNWHPDGARLLGILKGASQTGNVALKAYGVAMAQASASDPLVTVTNTNGWGNKPTGGSFRCPTAAKAALGTDGHLVVVQPDKSLWEMWKAVRSGSGWTAGAVGRADMGQWNYPVACCRGSSFSLLSGCLVPDDVVGLPSHALLLIAPSAAVRRAFMFPSNDTDGIQADGIPEGARLVLDPNANLSGLNPLARAIAKIGQTYGWILGDKTGGTDISFAALAPETWTAFGKPDPWAAIGLTDYPDISGLLPLLSSCRIESGAVVPRTLVSLAQYHDVPGVGPRDYDIVAEAEAITAAEAGERV